MNHSLAEDLHYTYEDFTVPIEISVPELLYILDLKYGTSCKHDALQRIIFHAARIRQGLVDSGVWSTIDGAEYVKEKERLEGGWYDRRRKRVAENSD